MGGDRVYGELSAGLEMALKERLTLSFLARGSLSENTRSAAGFARIALSF